MTFVFNVVEIAKYAKEPGPRKSGPQGWGV